MNLNIKPIQYFSDPDEAYRNYLTLYKKLWSMHEEGLLKGILWEVTLASGTIQDNVVFVNIVNKPINGKTI